MFTQGELLDDFNGNENYVFLGLIRILDVIFL